MNIPADEPSFSMVDLEDALGELSRHHPRAATVVDLRFLVGHTLADIGEILDISVSTVESDWRFARAWLRERLC
jgi:RNA polymerase sigma factor (sigma-70 family)